MYNKIVVINLSRNSNLASFLIKFGGMCLKCLTVLFRFIIDSDLSSALDLETFQIKTYLKTVGSTLKIDLDCC